ncbi:MAG: chemotaxis protein CheW [Synechococcaceae cyanobacterium ELA263]
MAVSSNSFVPVSSKTAITNPAVLLLLFSAGGPLYAMESKDVVEVIPRVSLRPAVNLPSYVPGLFNYRGVVVPVIDLCFLIQGCPSCQNLSSRIIMVTSGDNNDKDQYIGLLSEGVTDTISRPLTAFHETGLSSGSKPYLGGMTLDERGMVQILHLKVLLEQVNPIRDLIGLDQ